ncbi:MAG: Rne/Rng family ribonuclease [Candidatus Nanopelagicales bacterium]
MARAASWSMCTMDEVPDLSAREAMKGPSFMVDSTSTKETSTANLPAADASASGTSTTAPPRKRRAASRPAGPPPDSDAATPTTEPAAAKAASPRKKAAAKKPAKASASTSPAEDAPAKKPAKKSSAAKTPARKSAAGKSAAATQVAANDDVATPESPPTAAKRTRSRSAKATPDATEQVASDSASTSSSPAVAPLPLFQPPDAAAAAPSRSRSRRRPTAVKGEEPTASETTAEASVTGDEDSAGEVADDEPATRRRRRRGGRGRGKGSSSEATTDTDEADSPSTDAQTSSSTEDGEGDEESGDESTSARRRRRRRRRGQDTSGEPDDPAQTVVRVRDGRSRTSDVTSIKGSTRLEAKRQRRRDGRESGRRRAPILSEAEFLARRESVERIMLVRSINDRVQIAVLEDGVLVEHYVDQGTSSSMVGNVYLGRVQNVLPSMEAAFVDIGRGRNAVLYAGEVNWDAAGLDGQPRRIESALKSGDPIVVQVTKDPIGQKGARLTSQISLPGRYLVYVPDGSMTGISRKLSDKERLRLKAILKKVLPEGAGVIIRTAAEGASEEELTRDILRLQEQWEDIQAKQKTASPPSVISAEPDLAIKVIRDIFNEDFTRMVISGAQLRASVDEYVAGVAPELATKIDSWASPTDLFTEYRVEEQLTKALDRKVWLPSGGSLVIDRTEAMTVVDVNTGRFTGQGGNLEQTVTENNLEAAEEIVRQLRLRDIGGIIVVDFIDMVLESNRDLVLRRLIECLGRDRTKHQVAEVTSLGLVQMTRKRIGQGLIEAFSTTCESCGGRGAHVSLHPQPLPAVSDKPEAAPQPTAGRRKGKGVDPADVVAASS